MAAISCLQEISAMGPVLQATTTIKTLKNVLPVILFAVLVRTAKIVQYA